MNPFTYILFSLVLGLHVVQATNQVAKRVDYDGKNGHSTFLIRRSPWQSSIFHLNPICDRTDPHSVLTLPLLFTDKEPTRFHAV